MSQLQAFVFPTAFTVSSSSSVCVNTAFSQQGFQPRLCRSPPAPKVHLAFVHSRNLGRRILLDFTEGTSSKHALPSTSFRWQRLARAMQSHKTAQKSSLSMTMRSDGLSFDGQGKINDVSGDALKSKYQYWRYRVFSSIFVGYIASYLARGCFTYVAPLLRKEAGMTLEQLGVINSIFPVAYGVSKFVSGIMTDRVSPRVIMGVGLIASGLLDFLLTLSTSTVWISVVMGFNGLLAAFAAPACAKFLTSWFAQSERGTWWGAWNISTNLGGFLTAVVTASLASALGWKWGMYGPGLISIVFGLLFLAVVRSVPSDVGLPPVEEIYGTGQKPKEPTDAKAVAKDEEVQDPNTILVKYVLLNPYVWIMAIAYLALYFIRQGVTNWSHFYLMDSKGVTDAAEAAATVSGRELGGLIGGTFSGFASDKFFAGKRIPVIVLFFLGLAISIGGFWAVPSGHRLLDSIAVFMIGFFMYGPQMLMGVAGTEMAHKSAAASAIGFLGLISYLGAGIAGAPLTILVKKYGWNAFFVSMLAGCAFATALLVPLWNKKAYDDKPAT